MKPSIREIESKDKEKILELIGEVFDSRIAHTTQKLWDWLFINNPFNPDKNPHILVSEMNSDIIGFMFHIFVDLKIESRVAKARWGCNFITHPKNRGEGTSILKRSVEIPYYPLIGFLRERASDFVVKTTRPMSHKITGVYSRICILDMKAFLYNKFKNKFIACLGIIWNIVFKVFFKRQAYDKDLSIVEITSFDERSDKFWEEVCMDYPIITVRNQKYLNWRFVECPLKYRIFVALRDHRITGYIVLRTNKTYGLLRGYIVDILAKSNDKYTIDALIGKAVSYFKINGCDIAECLILTNKKTYCRALLKHGFLTKRISVYFSVYGKDKEELSVIKNIANWFITGSDPDLETWW